MSSLNIPPRFQAQNERFRQLINDPRVRDLEAVAVAIAYENLSLPVENVIFCVVNVARALGIDLEVKQKPSSKKAAKGGGQISESDNIIHRAS